MSAPTTLSRICTTLLGGVIVLGCSVLYDLSPDQCAADSECTGRFGKGYECKAGLCKASKSSSDDSVEIDAGGGCTSHAQCIEEYGDLDPRACIEGECVPLKTEGCPLLLPMLDDAWLNNLKTSDALILGAYSPIPESSLVSNFTRFFDFAVTQLTEKVHGVQGAGGERRQVVMVVCDGGTPTPDALLASATHLIDDLRVPGIVSTLQSSDVQYVFDKKAREAGTFFLSGLDADDTILNLDDNGLVWTMLTGPDSVAATYAPLLTRTIEYLRGPGEALSADEEVRVALLSPSGEPRFLQDIGEAITDTITFNGKSAGKNYPDNFKSIDIETLYGNADAALDQSEAIKTLLDYRPHVIIPIGAGEVLSSLIPGLEGQWEESVDQAPPFYLLSPYHINNPDMPTALQGRVSVARRMVGVNYAAAEDSSVYTNYIIDFDAAYGNAVREDPTRLGFENFYDAPYYLLYAVAAAGNPPRLTGSALAQGMTRLISGKNVYEVGERDMVDALSILENSQASITLKGTLGLATFDPSTGARNDAGSVWCVDQLGNFHPDILRWDAENEEFKDGDPDIGKACIAGF